MKWLLIVIWFGPSSSLETNAEFQTEALCKSAETALLASAEAKRKGGAVVASACVKTKK